MNLQYVRAIDKKTQNVVEGQLLHSKLVELNQYGYDIYLVNNLHSIPSHKHVRTEDITHICSFFADLDGNYTPKSIDSFLTPSQVICTGGSSGNAHLIWNLAIPSNQLDLFSVTQKRLAKLFNSDPKICDLPRIRRMPGFINHKTGMKADVVLQTGLTYTIEEFVSALDAALPEEIQDTPSDAPGCPTIDYSEILVPTPLPIVDEPTEASGSYLPGKIWKLVTEGLPRPGTRTMVQLEFVRTCMWAGVNLTAARTLWIRTLVRCPEHSNEATAGNWDYIKQAFNDCWEMWSREFQPLYHCHVCDSHLPKDSFSTDKTRMGGVGSKCKKCKAEEARNRRALKKLNRALAYLTPSA